MNYFLADFLDKLMAPPPPQSPMGWPAATALIGVAFALAWVFRSFNGK